jgi:hypothetical protein
VVFPIFKWESVDFWGVLDLKTRFMTVENPQYALLCKFFVTIFNSASSVGKIVAASPEEASERSGGGVKRKCGFGG